MSITTEPTLEEYLEQGPRLAGHSPVHLAVRGTPVANSVRCSWRGTARTPTQRDNAVRAWLGKEPTDTVPDTGYLKILFDAVFQVAAPDHQALIRSNFQAIADGESRDYLFLTCQADHTVNEYILGAGPATITVAYDRMGEMPSHDLHLREFYNGEFPGEPIRSEGEHQDLMAQALTQGEEALAQITGTNEAVLFLSPMGADHRIGIETWLTILQWDLQEEDGTVYAVRYGAPQGDPEYSQTLAGLKTRITTAAANDSHASDRIANASGLQTYYREIGAYGDITPDDGSTDTFTPAPPAAVMECAGSAAASTSSLVHDCQHLLDAESTLAGTAALNWATNLAISSWDGITTSGTPERITGLDLSDESLTGTIPAGLGELFELTTLDLSDNDLTGPIPHQLGWLHNLTELRLSGNSLTGCIPLALKDVATSDLSLLNLPHCRPPAPAGLQAAATGTTASLSWNAVTGAAKYRIEQRPGTGAEWTILDATLTGTTYTASALSCETTHQFRVSALGDGTAYQAAWSGASTPVRADSGPCNQDPAFPDRQYVFTTSDGAASGATLGAVAATDPDEGDILTYTITMGNEDAKFALDRTTGALTTNGALDYAAQQEYILAIGAQDSRGGSAATSVRVSITLAACHNGIAVPSPDGNPGPVQDCSALLTARETLEGIAGDLDWSQDTTIMDWEGLRMDGATRRVTMLLLPDEDLDGTIPAILGQMDDLRRVDLDENSLTGPIPSELANLDRLTHLYLHDNNLSGTIPTGLGALDQLQVLYIENNGFTGSIPTELAQMDRLRLLTLGGNRLTGSIPGELGNIMTLKELILRDNSLTGSIPASLEDLNLTRLDLSGNSLTGCIPAGLHDIPTNDLGRLALNDCS